MHLPIVLVDLRFIQIEREKGGGEGIVRRDQLEPGTPVAGVGRD
jgi:hypothetical protein